MYSSNKFYKYKYLNRIISVCTMIKILGNWLKYESQILLNFILVYSSRKNTCSYS